MSLRCSKFVIDKRRHKSRWGMSNDDFKNKVYIVKLITRGGGKKLATLFMIGPNANTVTLSHKYV